MRLGRLFEGDERQQATVSVLFIVAILAVVVALVGAVAIAYYNDNLRPLARVGPVEIGPGLMRDRTALETWRIDRDEGRITAAQISGEIDAETASVRLNALAQQKQALATSGLEDLIDTIFQSQLASQEGITVSDADVEARLTEEFVAIEKRHVFEIGIKPQAADAENGPSVTERAAALARAEEALAQLNGGADWATVAHAFSNIDSAPAGGDRGLLTANQIEDLDFGAALFELPLDGTTAIIRGGDRAYYIGRVTEIQTGGEEAGLREGLFGMVSETQVRQLLDWEAAAQAVHDKITDAALAATSEQVRLAAIFIEGISAEDPSADEGEIDYSEIVFAPGDNLEDAPDFPADDPRWAAALEEAQVVFNELKAITDVETRKTRFADIAVEKSDSPTSVDGGSVGFVTRDLPPTAIADALFDGTFSDGDIVGTAPVRADAAYYVLMFHEKRASPEDRMQAVRDALAAVGADFNAVARDLSEGPEKADGGELGWYTRDQLATEIADKVFALNAGQVTEPPLELGDGHYFVKVEEKENRAPDPDQIPSIRLSAFENWYTEKKTAAEDAGTITRADDTGLTDGDAGGDLLE